MKLYTYYRSSAAYRVRIALNLKGLNATSIPVSLVKDGGQQHAIDYRKKHPQGLVPLLEVGDDGFTQSLAIMEYLDEVYPGPELLPKKPDDRARVRALALAIACDVHPLNNLRVLKYLAAQLNVSDAEKHAWYQHWIIEGFTALEQSLSWMNSNGRFCFGETATMADCCLVPQVYNAVRFEVDMTPFPLISSINAHCLSQDEFDRAAPENQADSH